jgi:pimeloyl-ACP methyl ester carboxylesterase
LTAVPDVRSFAEAEERVLARYGVPCTTRSLELAEPRLRVRVLERGEGRPLVLVAGDGAVAGAWAPLLAELPERRLIVLDRPSFGLGSAFDYRGADLRAHGVAVLRSLLDALELERAPFAGSSGGGQWSLWLAAAAPERVSAVAALGIPAVCLPGFRADPAMRALSVPGLGQALFKLPAPSERATGRMLSSADAHLPEHPEIVALYHAARRLPAFGRSAAAIFQGSMRPGGRPRPQWVFRDEELAGFPVPALFVWGDREPYGPVAVAERAAALMPDARVAVIPGGWHHPWLADAPAAARAVRDFLAAHDA